MPDRQSVETVTLALCPTCGDPVSWSVARESWEHIPHMVTSSEHCSWDRVSQPDFHRAVVLPPGGVDELVERAARALYGPYPDAHTDPDWHMYLRDARAALTAIGLQDDDAELAEVDMAAGFETLPGDEEATAESKANHGLPADQKAIVLGRVPTLDAE